MKKLLATIVAFLALAGSAFAIDLSADINFGVPMSFTSSNTEFEIIGTHYSISSKNKETSLGANAGVTAMLTDMFGARLDLGYFVPQSMTTTTTTKIGSNNPSTTTTKTDYEDTTRSSFNVFVGPAINVYSKKNLVVYVNPGFNFDYRSYTVTTGSGESKTTTKYTNTYYGAGAEVQAKYKLNKNLAVNFNCPVIYNFKVIDSQDNEAETKGWYLIPMLGISYNF